MVETKLKIYFSYDGTAYHGFQRQKNVNNTVQEVLERALTRIADTRTKVMATGRTDTGVHARIQLAHTMVNPALFQRLGSKRFVQSLNSLLPLDVRVLRVEEADLKFHAIRSVKKKTYMYFIDVSPIQTPFLRNYAWHLWLPLDWVAMRKATEHFVGTHDFRAFCAANSSAKTTVRTIYEASWQTKVLFGETQLMAFQVIGSGFLKQMIRSMVGTLVQVGNHKRSVESVAELLRVPNRKKSGPTAPAHGLWLWDILDL